MGINYLAVLVCGIFSLVLGFIWYGPLFGKKWMHLMGAGSMSEEQKKAAMKNMWKLYLTQFLLSLFQMWVLAWYVGAISSTSGGMHTAFSIWIAFVMPTVATASMWNGEPAKKAWTRFLIQAGYLLVLFIVCGFILGAWMS